MIALRREIFLLNYTKADRLNTVRNKRTQIIQQERTNFQSYEEKMKQLNVIVPEILTKEHNRQNYKESMLIPIRKIFQDLNFANKEIFEVIDLYLQYEIQFIKSYTLIEMRDSPNYQDETTKQVLEYLSNLNYGQFEISDLINTEIIEQLAFIITNSQHPWIVEQTIYTLLQLLIMDDKQMMEKFKQLKIISPCIDNVLNLGYFHNKYFIELVSNLITEFSLFDEYQDYGDYFQVITFWNKILETEYDDYLYQIQLEASLFYSIYLLSRNYNDIQWEFIYDQEESQLFLEDAMTRISKLTFKDHDSDNLKHAINGYKAVYYGMINNMISNLDAFEVLNFYSEKLISMLLMDLKSDSQEIIDLDCSILFGLITCDVKLRLDILRSHIYNWFHIILDVNFNQTINKSQIINVLLEAINFDDQNYIMELMQQDIIKALVHSIEQHDLTSQQFSEILSAMIFISNIQNDYLSTLISLNDIQWNQFIAYVLQDRRIIILIQDKIQDMYNKQELESILGQLVQLTNIFAQKRMKYHIK